jgi:hypothetical protein
MSGTRKAWTAFAEARAARPQPASQSRPPRRSDGSGAKPKALTEHQLHVSVAQYLDRVLLPDKCFWSTFPSGGYALSPIASALLKRRGLKPGMPDIFIWFWREDRTCCCVGVELKVKTWPSRVQKDVFYKMRKLGVNIWICRSIEDVTKALEKEGVPTRESHHEIYDSDPPRVDLTG